MLTYLFLTPLLAAATAVTAAVPVDRSLIQELSTALGLVLIGALQAVSLWWNRRNHTRLVEVNEKQDQIYKLVNHPMGVALDGLATALEKIAEISDTDAARQVARSARTRSDAHNSQQAIADAAELQAAQKNLRRKVCLLMDHDETSATLIKALVTRAGWSVDVAESSQIAMRMATDHDYQIILIDFNILEEPGGTLLHAMRELNPLAKIVVVISSVTDLSKLPTGAYFGFIIRPVTLAAVRAALVGT